MPTPLQVKVTNDSTVTKVDDLYAILVYIIVVTVSSRPGIDLSPPF